MKNNINMKSIKDFFITVAIILIAFVMIAYENYADNFIGFVIGVIGIFLIISVVLLSNKQESVIS